MSSVWPAFLAWPAGWRAAFGSPSFLWPQVLWALAALPLLLALHFTLQHRRRRAALAYPGLTLVRQALGRGPGWRRHVPPALMLAALATLIVAGARPVAVLALPSGEQTIILAMDVSGSMRAGDVKPSRLAAAQAAAKAFLAELPRGVKVGVVAFAGSAQLAQLPTTSRQDAATAIDRFQLQRATATGNAIVISLATLLPDAGIELQQFAGERLRGSLGRPIEQPPPRQREFVPVPPGSYRSAAVIMLTDGQRTTGVDPLEAAGMAAARGVRVYTVGIGTTEGDTIGIEGWSMRVRLDEETLKSIARITAAEYFHAGTAQDLRTVYQNLSSRLTLERKETELAGVLALLGAALALLAAGLSSWWFARVL